MLDYYRYLYTMSNEFASALKKLEKEKLRVSAQLADITTAIDSLIKVNASLNLDAPVGFLQDHTNKEKTLPYSDFTVIIPSLYESDLTLPEMLTYALYLNKGAFAHEAAEFIYQLDVNIDIENLKKRFTDIASALARAKKIDYKKIGKKYKYFLKKEDVGIYHNDV